MDGKALCSWRVKNIFAAMPESVGSRWPSEGGWEVGEEDGAYYSYYGGVRLALLCALLLIASHCVAHVYIRWRGERDDGGRDAVPLLLCAVSHGVVWAHTLLILLQLTSFVDAASLARRSASSELIKARAPS